jgi:hypothetical protein
MRQELTKSTFMMKLNNISATLLMVRSMVTVCSSTVAKMTMTRMSVTVVSKRMKKKVMT